MPHLFTFDVVLASGSFPILVTTITYITLLLGENKPSNWTRTKQRIGQRLTITVVIASVIFPFTWLPYPIVLSIMNLCFERVFSNVKLCKDLTGISKSMHLTNSFMNPALAYLRIP